jgi:hypothetical protein
MTRDVFLRARSSCDGARCVQVMRVVSRTARYPARRGNGTVSRTSRPSADGLRCAHAQCSNAAPRTNQQHRQQRAVPVRRQGIEQTSKRTSNQTEALMQHAAALPIRAVSQARPKRIGESGRLLLGFPAQDSFPYRSPSASNVCGAHHLTSRSCRPMHQSPCEYLCARTSVLRTGVPGVSAATIVRALSREGVCLRPAWEETC